MEPVRKKTKVEHDFSTVTLTDVGCSSLHQYSSSHYSINNGSINSYDLAGSNLFFDSTWCYPEECWDTLSQINVNNVAQDQTIYDWPTGSAEPALHAQMIDDFAMDAPQSQFGCLDLIAHGERLINSVDEDEDEDVENWENPNETPEDSQEAGAERDEFVPEICFGMIQDNLIADVHRVKRLAKDDMSSCSYDVNLSQEEGLITVYSEAGEYIGRLETGISNGLVLLGQNFSVKFEAYIPAEQSKSIAININIYGLSQASDLLGDALSDANLFLQRPLKYDSAFEYRNPHYFQVPHLELANLRLDNDPAGKNSTDGQQRAYHIQDGLSDLLGAASNRSRVFKPCTISDRLSTALLEHQRHGLSFMKEKEEDLGGYQTNDQTQSIGGILADGMGLGKSLTTLALIAGTLPSMSAPQASTHSRATLLIVPASTLATWQEQIERHMKPNSLDFLIYHGRQRKLDQSNLQARDMVITTYSTLVAEWRSNSTLYNNRWFRIVLDEAHLIRDPSTKRAQAIFAIEGERRWCLTGTPIHNRISDLVGLLKFMRIHPLQSHTKFQAEIINPLKRNDPDGLSRLQSMLRVIMLRRTKEILTLPPREDIVQYLELSAPERELYDIFRDESRSLIDTILREDTSKRGFSIMQSFLRQRQICNHGSELLPSLVRAGLDRKRRIQGWRNGAAADEMPIFCEACEAEIDFSAWKNRASFDFCFHLVCTRCLKTRSPEAGSSNACPVCNEEDSDRKSVRKKGPSLADWFRTTEYRGPSTKVTALINNIQSTNPAGSAEKPKSVVFSGWTKMLYLIEKAFQEAQITSVRLDGTLSLKERQSVLKDFETKPNISVLLISIGTGSVGLNLTAASQVHIMEPQWNPMVESQALDRVHRLGQQRPVKTIRYVMKSSFDESMLELQRMKLDLAELSLGTNEGKGADQMRLRLEKLRGVFK